ncbi:MAG: glycosyltransferase family 4 protein [Prolixibacteraceae bacterium]|nr:glycosyltransferase family 4 protein [Prolixibacteraceae bacterium]
MKKVLIITYYWPPGSSPGVQRYLKFSKYLNDFGWQPYILTVKNRSYPSVDHSLLNDVPDNVTVYRTNTIEPFSLFNLLKKEKGDKSTIGLIGLTDKKTFLKRMSLWIRANFFIPDARKYWRLFAYKKAKKIIKTNNIDAIVTTGPPHSTHLIGYKLKKNTNIPWIADFRDPWINIFYNKFFPRTSRTQRKDKLLEDRVIKNSDALIVVSKGMLKEFQKRSKNISIIYNGYDAKDIPKRKETATQKFILSYIGNFKPNQNIDIIWKAISELSKEDKDFNNLFQLDIIGNISSCVNNDVKKYKIENKVNLFGFVKHDEAVTKMIQANALLFIIPQVENNKLIITGKLFEYLASKTPIISIGPTKGNASEILKESLRSPMIDYADFETFKLTLLDEFKNWLLNGKTTAKLNKGDVEQYERRNLTQELSSILNELTNKKNEHY